MKHLLDRSTVPNLNYLNLITKLQICKKKFLLLENTHGHDIGNLHLNASEKKYINIHRERERESSNRCAKMLNIGEFE